MSKPLEGIKVVEIAQEIQGPFASLILADMGADVVKVENKETGDLSRWMLAALIGGPEVRNATVSHYFIAMNRGKRSPSLSRWRRRATGLSALRWPPQYRSADLPRSRPPPVP